MRMIGKNETHSFAVEDGLNKKTVEDKPPEHESIGAEGTSECKT